MGGRGRHETVSFHAQTVKHTCHAAQEPMTVKKNKNKHEANTAANALLLLDHAFLQHYVYAFINYESIY